MAGIGATRRSDGVEVVEKSLAHRRRLDGVRGTPLPRGSVLDVALCTPRRLFGSLPLRKRPLREHPSLRIL